MIAGMSRVCRISGKGPMVDIINVVELLRFKLPCVLATFTAPSNDDEPE